MDEELLDVLDFIERGETDDSLDYYQTDGGTQNVPQPESLNGISS